MLEVIDEEYMCGFVLNALNKYKDPSLLPIFRKYENDKIGGFMKIDKYKILIGICILLILLVGIVVFFLISPDNKWTGTKRVEGLVITDANITFDNSISVSFLSADVRNSSKENKKDVKLKITFLDKSKKEITSATGFLGDIEANQTRELNAAVSTELNDVFDIKYEILK